MSKGWWKSVLVVSALVLVLAPGAVAKVTLDWCSNGEATWYGDEEGEITCSPCPDCLPDLATELGVFASGSWAAVWLDAAEKFKINEITALGFRYMHLDYLGLLPANPAGPGCALALEWYDSGEYKAILAISAPAPIQTGSCAPYDAFAGNWYYGTWDGANLCSYVPVQTAAGTWSALVSTLNGTYPASVKAVGAYMWHPGASGNAEPTRAIVDDIVVRWTNAACPSGAGGVYDLEPEDPDPASVWPLPVTFETEWQRNAWTRTGLWTWVESNELFGELLAVQNFPSQNTAAYFGNVSPTTGTGSYNGTGARVSGYLMSPCNFLNPGDKYVDIGFDYYRLVEQYKGAYPNQVYDRTWLEIRWIRGGNGCPTPDPWETASAAPSKVTSRVLWYRDSSTPPEGQWTRVDLAPLTVPCDAVGIQMRFGFDSIDGKSNDFLGWLIDNVTKTHSPDPSCLEILTPTLPQATVKVDYGELIEELGVVGFLLQANKPGVRWEIDERGGDPLPDRLVLEPGTGLITGHPEVGTQGTYKILIRAIYGDGRDCNTAEKLFILAVRAPEGPMASNTIYAQYFDPANGQTPSAWYGGSGWDLSCALWHLTEAVYYKNADIVTSQYGTAAYFGKTTNTTSNYHTGRQVKCCLTSPWISIPSEYIGEKVILGFKSWREVEYYTKGAYDKTWVEVRFEGQPWKLVWSKDSRDESLADWTWEELDTCLAVPPGLPKFQVRFCFDSVDGHNNNYVGWLVDEVALFAGSAALAITTPCPLPDGAVGLPYSVKFTASGGPAGTKVWQMTNVPPGLEFDPATQILSGIPREEGTFPFTIKVTVLDGGSNPIAEAEKPCALVIGEQVLLLFEDFEKDPVWNWGGLWHITAGVTGVPGLSVDNRAAYYGKDDLTAKPNYNTGNRTTGSLTLVSPVISLTGVDAFKVFFDYWREVEPFSANGAFDIAVVQVALNGGTWKTIWQKTSADPCDKKWLKAEIGPFLTNGATTMLIRFVFDSVDKWHNNFLGWLIDNIRVEKAPTAGAVPLSAAAIAPAVVSPRGVQIDFFNSPNPVRDVNTTTFAVRGVDAERIKVEIYDLAGRLVYVNEVLGSELVWHTQDATGLPLANGVYLYKVYVKVGEAWVVSSVQKLTVLR